MKGEGAGGKARSPLPLDLVKQMVQEGWQPRPHSKHIWMLRSRNGEVLTQAQIGRPAMDYARSLITPSAAP